MTSLLDDAASWLGDQLNYHAGLPCRYVNAKEAIDITLVPRPSNADRGGLDFLRDGNTQIRSEDFTAVLAELAIADVVFLPAAGDEIEWTDELGQTRIGVVFPRVGERCFNFTGPSRKQVTIYTVAKEAMEPLTVYFANGEAPAELMAVAGAIRGAEDFLDGRAETRVLTTVAYVAASQLPQAPVPPAAATCDFLGLEGWAIDLNRCEWGRGLLKIGLVRETLIREWQARRNATV